MATERNRPSSSRRNTIKNIIRLIPAVVIMAAMLNTASCNSSGLLQPVSSNSKTPTSTPTPGTGALAFVTNFNDAMVSSFTRNLTTGVLKLKGQVTAGAKHGPKGVVAEPNGTFVYVANNKDDNIYEFSVNQTNGKLTPLSPPSVSNGAGSGPDEIAINAAGTFLWVTGAGANKGTVTTYGVGISGQLTQNTTKVTGLMHPFGIAVDSTNSIVYVADTAAGLVYSYKIGTSGALTKTGSVPDLGSPGGSPGFIAIDPAFAFIYVTDLNAGQLSVLGTNSGTLSFSSLMPLNTTGNKPIGIGYATLSSGNFVYTANQGNSSLWSFPLPTAGHPSQPVEFGTGNLNAPTGLVVDPQNAFLYTTNQNAGTVSQFSLSPTCSPAPPPCFVGNVATESPATTASGAFGITLAQ
jgi:6-phosphogluconolactonase (cycloisomerase 2 family)